MKEDFSLGKHLFPVKPDEWAVTGRLTYSGTLNLSKICHEIPLPLLSVISEICPLPSSSTAKFSPRLHETKHLVHHQI